MNTDALRSFFDETVEQTKTEDTEKVTRETEAVTEQADAEEETEKKINKKERESKTITEPTFLVTVENGTGGGYYRSGEKVLIEAEIPEGSGLEFSGWEVTEGDVPISGRMQENAYFIMPKADVSVTAKLTEITYTVTVENDEGSGDYSAGDKVTLKANEPEENYEFETWEIKSGDLVLSDGASETAFFYMPRGDAEISAVYR